MTRIVFLDAGPLGMITNPNASAENMRCLFWLRSLVSSGVEVVLSEITDYEVRRELIRARKTHGLQRLDALKNDPSVRFSPLTTETMLRAAELWAQARQGGHPTADPKALDCDVILAAQAQLEDERGSSVLIATSNIGHLARFTAADHWHKIPPLGGPR